MIENIINNLLALKPTDQATYFRLILSTLSAHEIELLYAELPTIEV